MRIVQNRFLYLFIALVLCGACSDKVVIRHERLTSSISQYERVDFEVVVKEPFENPYDALEIALNMILTSPSGHTLLLPCYFDRKNGEESIWMARFAPREVGKYAYHFELLKDGEEYGRSTSGTFAAEPSGEDGFLHIDGFWALKFDSGRPFRGIGENVGWESRSFSDPKWNYDYLLPRLSAHGANFFRAWMSPNNFPLEWKTVKDTKRYSNTEEYFNPGGVRRLDEVLELADSLGLCMMLAFDSHNALMENNQWEIHNYNVKNGGPAATPLEFFTLKESRDKYKNRLRYIVARWGYSTSLGAWEFFNEIDNAAYSKKDSILIPHEAIAHWHQEMASYLKAIDPYDHIVTTSVSHREIEGMFDLPQLDLNQMHIYKRTDHIPAGIDRYIQTYNKPFSWGEFAYEWDWNKDFKPMAHEFDFDFKRGLWYGLFSPTPILPMSWWWEFFDERGMTAYFRHVREINDRMLAAGGGSFERMSVESRHFETLGAKCGDRWFIYALNTSDEQRTSMIRINAVFEKTPYHIESYDPNTGSYRSIETGKESSVTLPEISLPARSELIIILSPARGGS